MVSRYAQGLHVRTYVCLTDVRWKGLRYRFVLRALPLRTDSTQTGAVAERRQAHVTELSRHRGQQGLCETAALGAVAQDESEAARHGWPTCVRHGFGQRNTDRVHWVAVLS